MTRTTRLRRTILHLLQIFFTEAITFIVVLQKNRVLPYPPAHFPPNRPDPLAVPYFARKTIRPRVRSYGVSSTVTLSPGRMRM